MKAAALDSFREKVAGGSCENKAALKATLDASDCPEYVEQWCAHMRLGEDGDIGTPGVRRWRELGGFREIADNAHSRRKEDVYVEGVGAQEFDETERDFVEAYVSEVGDPSSEAIARGIKENIDQLGGDPTRESIEREIRRTIDELFTPT